MICVNGCMCTTKWQILKAHLRQCWYDWKNLNSVCEVAAQMKPLQSVDDIYQHQVQKIRDLAVANFQGKYASEEEVDKL